MFGVFCSPLFLFVQDQLKQLSEQLVACDDFPFTGFQINPQLEQDFIQLLFQQHSHKTKIIKNYYFKYKNQIYFQFNELFKALGYLGELQKHQVFLDRFDSKQTALNYLIKSEEILANYYSNNKTAYIVVATQDNQFKINIQFPSQASKQISK